MISYTTILLHLYLSTSSRRKSEGMEVDGGIGVVVRRHMMIYLRQPPCHGRVLVEDIIVVVEEREWKERKYIIVFH